jgi:hypothetical protein
MVKTDPKRHIRRRPFPSWSIELPRAFRETFVDESPGHWHAYDSNHSVSLTSMQLSDPSGSPVPARSVLRRFRAPRGEAIDVLPAGFAGWRVFAQADADARASRRLSGILATDGHVLILTITSDDDAWTRKVWLSICREGALRIVGHRSARELKAAESSHGDHGGRLGA